MSEMGEASQAGVPVGVPVSKPPVKKPHSNIFWIFLFLFVGLAFVLLAGLFASIISPSSSPVLSHKKIGVIDIKGVILESEDSVEQIRDFSKENGIEAIIVRIDSPGGAIVPSQEIFEALLKAREKKLVIASMGSMAASGGYYIAAASDTILANSGTITGSIGVIMNLLNIKELQEWAKLKTYTIKSGPFKDIASSTKPLSDKDREILQGIIDEMLEQFVQDISRGRDMDVEEVRRLADGRIFTGNMAKENGLVDEIGTFYDAVDLAAKSLGIDGEPKLVYPPEEKRGLLDLLTKTMVSELSSKIFEFHYLENIPIFQYIHRN